MLSGVARLALALVTLSAGSGWIVASGRAAEAQTESLYPMVFPVAGRHSFTDTFGATRGDGRSHQGIDIFADKLTSVVAVADGTIRTLVVGERSGRYIVVEHSDGWLSYYLHLNNDSPGTDDGARNEPVAGIRVGATVKAGDLLDYVGDSGNAESTPSHLHFELHRPGGAVTNPYPHLLRAAGASSSQIDTALQSASVPAPTTLDTVTLGRFDPGGGFAAGVWVHSDVAYLGTWGRPGACPASGVRMIDVTDFEEPQQIGSLATGDEYPGTDTDSVWAGSIETDSFVGDVVVIAVSLCDNSEQSRIGDGFRGLALYDVTNPAQPQLLSIYDSGARTQGVHDLDVVARSDGRVLVAATVMQSFLHTEGRQGDVRLIDISNPWHPIEVGDWDFRRDAPPEEVAQLLDDVGDEELHAHSVSFVEGGYQLWVANWDAGAVLLDIDDLAAPGLLSRIQQAPSGEGNVHSVLSDGVNEFVVLASEDFHPEEVGGHAAGWGQLAIVDSAGRPLAGFVAGDGEAETDDDVALDGFHTAHDAQLHDGRLYVSYYSDGVRIVDLSDPTDPVEIGYFIPPPTTDPQGYWVAPDGTRSLPMVWGVHMADDVLFVSDMNSGLWIARYTGDDPVAPHPS